MLWSLAYASRAMIDRRSVDILEIARTSMRNNIALRLSGALYFDDLQFFQVLEGERETVALMFARIRCDSRHSDVVLLQEGAIETRRFPEWSMKFIDGGWIPRSRENFGYHTLCGAGPEALQARLGELRAY